jgi:hypothetical protein
LGQSCSKVGGQGGFSNPSLHGGQADDVHRFPIRLMNEEGLVGSGSGGGCVLPSIRLKTLAREFFALAGGSARNDEGRSVGGGEATGFSVTLSCGSVLLRIGDWVGKGSCVGADSRGAERVVG